MIIRQFSYQVIFIDSVLENIFIKILPYAQELTSTKSCTARYFCFNAIFPMFKVLMIDVNTKIEAAC